MYIKNIYILLLLFIAINSFNCKNPFFPTKGLPEGTGAYNTSISGVVKQIMNVYENKDIAAFENLIYDKNTFKFYIQYNIFKDVNINNINTKVSLDFDYVPIGSYWYLDYSQEHRVHSNLFSHENEISFTEPLVITKEEFPEIIDSTNTDTLEVVIHTDKATINIRANLFFEIYGSYHHDFTISEQVFFLKKDTVDNLWKIDKWFEIN